MAHVGQKVAFGLTGDQRRRSHFVGATSRRLEMLIGIAESSVGRLQLARALADHVLEIVQTAPELSRQAPLLRQGARQLLNFNVVKRLLQDNESVRLPKL